MIITLTNEQTTNLIYLLRSYINQFPLKPEVYVAFYKDDTIDKEVIVKIINEAKYRIENRERIYSVFSEVYNECISIIDKIIY